MFLNIKPVIFLNELTFEINELHDCLLKAVLRDDKGNICGALETESRGSRSVHKWEGLNDLPYGVYTCEVSGGNNEIKTRLIKGI